MRPLDEIEREANGTAPCDACDGLGYLKTRGIWNEVSFDYETGRVPCTAGCTNGVVPSVDQETLDLCAEVRRLRKLLAAAEREIEDAVERWDPDDPAREWPVSATRKAIADALRGAS